MYQYFVNISDGVSLGLDIFTVLVSMVLLYLLFSERHTKGNLQKYFIAIPVTNAVSAIADFSIKYITVYQLNINLIGPFYDISYVSFMLTIMFLSFCQYETMRQKIYVADGILYTMAFVCNAPSLIWLIGNGNGLNWFYSISSNGVIEHGNLFWLSVAFPVLILLFNFVFMLTCKKEMVRNQLFAWLSYEMFPFVVWVVYAITGTFYEAAIFTAISLSLLLLYGHIHLGSIIDGIVTENQLNKSQMKLMVSQIQPHFMYNALNSIYVLIDKDKDQAQEAVAMFSDYLRQNINSLKSDQPVAFEEELEHTKAYIYLEQIRFGDKLKVLYNIKATDFKIPPLSVQPLVENAIKHGISKKPGGGTVEITSREDDKNYVVEIIDNGLGFNAGEFSSNDKHTHIGLFNVNSRLVNMVNGNLTVKSQHGVGTVCTITIVKEKRTKND
ncbi:MAG: histidine kinase [Bacillota bacterium]|nr:histidine kinase [Bacillota bacterium]